MRALRLRPETLIVIGGLALVAAVFLSVSSKNPPGFYRDESAISYNAYTLSQSLKDEFGGRIPLFIKSYGDYKSPLYVYLLAAVFRVTGPSTHDARVVSAVVGLAAILVLYALALAITRKRLLALAAALLAGLSPWLFEISRLVFEVALEPVLIAGLLLVVYRASTGWRLSHSIAIGLLLAAIAYTYQAGRVLAPAFAVGLLLFFGRGRRRRLGELWAVFAASMLPIGVYEFLHTGALTARYHAVTFIHGGMSWPDIAWQFVKNYAKNLNLWDWLVAGDANQRHHVPGDGSLFFVEVGLALIGLAIVLLRRRSDPWWRFVVYALAVTPIAASLTNQTIHSLRMIALPVLLPVLALPALEAISGLRRPRMKAAVVGALAIAFAVEAVHWQVVFHQNGPDRLDAFEAQIHPVIEAALAHGGTIYAYRDDHTTYTDSLWFGTIAGRPRSSFDIVERGAKLPPGALVVGRVGECPTCTVVSENDGYEAYVTGS